MSGNISGDKQGSWGPFWKRRWLLASRCQADNFFLRYFCVKFIIIYYISSTAIFPTSGSNVAIPALLARRHATSDSTKLSFFFSFSMIISLFLNHHRHIRFSPIYHVRYIYPYVSRGLSLCVCQATPRKGEGDINGAKR